MGTKFKEINRLSFILAGRQNRKMGGFNAHPAL
jgi:hypothetical protein